MAPKKMTLAACLKLHYNMAPKKRRLAGRQWIQKEEEVHMGPMKARHPESKDIPTEFKGAIVEAAAAVVSLESYHAGPGGETMFVGSGTIIGCEDVNGTYTSTILTSATLLRSSTESNALQDDIEVNVYLADGKSFKGHLSAHDLHFNIAALSITSDVALPTARLRPLDDSISIDPSEIQDEEASRSFQLHRHSDSFKICPGDMVVALGRHCGVTHELWAALGKFSVDCCRFDCRELFRANCRILESGVGGPLINRHGEVIGVNFFDVDCTPFMPINIVSKCLKRFQENRQCCRPWSGMELTNLYAARIGKVEKVFSRFNISKGVLVEEVIKGSPAKQAGILRGDVIVQCEKKSVQGFLEFCDVIWENVGKSIEVVVVRESSAAHLNLKLFVDETSPDKVNRWPIPESRWFKIGVN
ncbi:putative protease Do-like 14 [Rhododendron vialii]|uniref:putative protease Do-like 14 n=1 Tax=Rhododendron vialii TaxID=182163 RepID=UPI00265F4D74|nr:putative protease Do-like 14 [Rhododendron vialii]XP_058184463.1 putative protease Do-like 14 [Rhododendron vialii]XP_058184471.1 putative protease Do-like 14 [Rhododendron vialii]